MKRWLPITALLTVWVLGLMALWMTQPKYIIDLRHPNSGNVMSSNFPSQCADIAAHYLGAPGKGRVTINTLKYNDMIRELQRCVSQVKSTGVPGKG